MAEGDAWEPDTPEQIEEDQLTLEAMQPMQRRAMAALDDVAEVACCRIHTQHPLTQVERPPVYWSYCGMCEGERVRKFIDSMRDPDMKRRFERALIGVKA